MFGTLSHKAPKPRGEDSYERSGGKQENKSPKKPLFSYEKVSTITGPSMEHVQSKVQSWAWKNITKTIIIAPRPRYPFPQQSKPVPSLLFCNELRKIDHGRTRNCGSKKRLSLLCLLSGCMCECGALTQKKRKGKRGVFLFREYVRKCIRSVFSLFFLSSCSEMEEVGRDFFGKGPPTYASSRSL